MPLRYLGFFKLALGMRPGHFSMVITHRLAIDHDIDALRALMAAAIDRNQREFLRPEQIGASYEVMGLDTQLIADGTYFIVERNGIVVGCGGWSFRATTHGGDHSAPLRNAATLDPAADAARVRAMYTHPDHVRQGIGSLILTLCEGAAREAGFGRAMLMATLSGEPLYRSAGYVEAERVASMTADGVEVPLIRMEKALIER